jgi:N-acetylglucosaminyldiphosphoundecaprenol N-acetyl-beta-D-mannosaminyltransferase
LKASVRPSVRILGGRVDRITLAGILSLVQNAVLDRSFLHILTVNALMLLESEKDMELRTVFDRAELAVSESSGITLALRLKNIPPPERIPGIDLVSALAKLAGEEQWSVYLVGSKPGVAEEAGKKLEGRFPGLRICGARDGYFNTEQEKLLLADITAKKPQLIFSGLGMPAQEKWIDAHLRGMQGACAVGVGGSFDVLSGNLKRAPAWMSGLGVEWLYRFFQEPWRFERMAKLPVFVLKVFRQKFD